MHIDVFHDSFSEKEDRLSTFKKTLTKFYWNVRKPYFDYESYKKYPNIQLKKSVALSELYSKFEYCILNKNTQAHTLKTTIDFHGGEIEVY